MSSIQSRSTFAVARVVQTARVRIWALAVLAMTLFLALQGASLAIVPTIAGGLGAGVLVSLFLAAMVCEYIDSALGMGYGTTLTPLLLVAGFEPQQVVPCILFSEFLTGFGAALMHHRDGNMDLIRDRRTLGTAALLSSLSVFGAAVAVTLAVQVPQIWVKTIIAVVILSVGLLTLATIGRRLRFRPGHIVMLGAVAAFNKGISGGGYGPLVTAGQVVSGMPSKSAVGITSLAESLTCLAGLVGYLMVHGRIEWALTLPLTLGAVFSVPVATLTVRTLSEKAMRTGVGLFSCGLGLLMVVKLIW